MVNINPISKEFEEATHDSNSNIRDYQPKDHASVENSVVDMPVTTTSVQQSAPNSILLNNSSNIKEDIENKKLRNELIAINVFAVLGIISSLICLASIISNETNMKAFSINSCFAVCDLLLSIFILRKTDIARKIAIFFGYLTLALSLITIFIASIFSMNIRDVVPNIILAVFVICFLGSERIKRHFA